MQVRVPGTPASGCTKDFRRKCTGAGEVAKVTKTNNAVWRGEARTYLHQTWTEESLDRGGHLDSLAGFVGPRSSSMDPPRLGESCKSVVPPDGRQQALLAANRAVGVFGRCCGPGWTRTVQIGPEGRGDVEQDKEPSQQQVAPGEVQETGTTRMRETVLA
ncbi:hypothetical protein NDU88_011709 [Pleurodeles waltl]|uniref:Uncharacterized protein n=1 Tax=Pleurodeles waltl TaxID=8319 RepID=A0AAV7S3G0_PLEWA|nr:hypothetical protein NDU88_011709 [Pleurodeles waltl]